MVAIVYNGGLACRPQALSSVTHNGDMFIDRAADGRRFSVDWDRHHPTPAFVVSCYVHGTADDWVGLGRVATTADAKVLALAYSYASDGYPRWNHYADFMSQTIEPSGLVCRDVYSIEMQFFRSSDGAEFHVIWAGHGDAPEWIVWGCPDPEKADWVHMDNYTTVDDAKKAIVEYAFAPQADKGWRIFRPVGFGDE